MDFKNSEKLWKTGVGVNMLPHTHTHTTQHMSRVTRASLEGGGGGEEGGGEEGGGSRSSSEGRRRKTEKEKKTVMCLVIKLSER